MQQNSPQKERKNISNPFKTSFLHNKNCVCNQSTLYFQCWAEYNHLGQLSRKKKGKARPGNQKKISLANSQLAIAVVFTLRRMLERSHFCSLPATIAVFSTVVKEFNWSTVIAWEWENSKEDRCHQVKPPALVEELEIINRTAMEMEWIGEKLLSGGLYMSNEILIIQSYSFSTFAMLIIMVNRKSKEYFTHKMEIYIHQLLTLSWKTLLTKAKLYQNISLQTLAQVEYYPSPLCPFISMPSNYMHLLGKNFSI